MNLKKYRICLILFAVAVIAISVIFYAGTMKKTEVPTDGMLVKNMEALNEENV